jgi:hypothetical protein
VAQSQETVMQNRSSMSMKCLPAALLLALAVTTGNAIAGPATSSADAAYRQERADCLVGRSVQDRATCLKEAAVARADAQRQRLGGAETAAQLRANALQRCQRQPADERAACERMALGEGRSSGSVAEGAVLRELTVRSDATAQAVMR